MKVLLAIDGSPASDVAVEQLLQRPLPKPTQIEVLTVAHASVPEVPDPFLFTYAVHQSKLRKELLDAPGRVEHAASVLRDHPDAPEISTKVLEGSPKRMIVEEAEEWGADLVVVGSHGFGPARRFLLGSVAQAVTLHAPCSVEVVRPKGLPMN